MRRAPAGWVVTHAWPTTNAPTYDGWAATLYEAVSSPDTMRDLIAAESVHLGPHQPTRETS